MRALTNINARSISEAVVAAEQARAAGDKVAFSGGGTDLLQQIKDGTADVDVIINLRTVTDASDISVGASETQIGGLVTLTALANETRLGAGMNVLREAAVSVGTPQIRNVGTLAGNITQRPWCWYYRNGFSCFKAGGDRCFSVTGENQQHAIFGGGPSYIVHPSDTAPALVALGARFAVTGPAGMRLLSPEEFFVTPQQDPSRENSLSASEMLTAIHVPNPTATTVSTYFKVMDRAAWTHAEVSAAVVLQRDGDRIASARVVLGGVAPIPWRVSALESFLSGKTLDAAVANEAGALAIADARPLAKNGYKLPMTSAAVERALLHLISA